MELKTINDILHYFYDEGTIPENLKMMIERSNQKDPINTHLLNEFAIVARTRGGRIAELVTNRKDVQPLLDHANLLDFYYSEKSGNGVIPLSKASTEAYFKKIGNLAFLAKPAHTNMGKSITYEVRDNGEKCFENIIEFMIPRDVIFNWVKYVIEEYKTKYISPNREGKSDYVVNKEMVIRYINSKGEDTNATNYLEILVEDSSLTVDQVANYIVGWTDFINTNYLKLVNLLDKRLKTITQSSTIEEIEDFIKEVFEIINTKKHKKVRLDLFEAQSKKKSKK